MVITFESKKFRLVYIDYFLLEGNILSYYCGKMKVWNPIEAYDKVTDYLCLINEATKSRGIIGERSGDKRQNKLRRWKESWVDDRRLLDSHVPYLKITSAPSSFAEIKSFRVQLQLHGHGE